MSIEYSELQFCVMEISDWHNLNPDPILPGG